jgi:thiosulfate/3-mercaptopyruvate sulfurtransferase
MDLIYNYLPPNKRRKAMSDTGFHDGFRERLDLVSTTWLAARLEHPDIAIVDASVVKELSKGDLWVSDRAAFEAGHIPGARFADLVSDFSDVEEAFAFTRPTAARLAAAAQATGLTNRQRIVVYDNSTGIWAARLWWLFKAFGHQQVSVLDGGLTAWRVGGGALERGPGAVEPTSFVANERPGFFVDTDEVLAVVEGRATGLLVCVLHPKCSRELSRGTAVQGTYR